MPGLCVQDHTPLSATFVVTSVAIMYDSIFSFVAEIFCSVGFVVRDIDMHL